jgi:putative transposase
MDGYEILEGVYVYFVTFTTIDWLPVFINPEPTQILLDSLNFCIANKNLRIHAYVIMPNHIHMIVYDAEFDNLRLQKTITSFRKFTGNKLANYVDHNFAKSISAVTRNQQLKDRARQIWQPGWHSEGLVSEKVLHQKIGYIHENPVRKGYVRLPEYWENSSAGFWIMGEEGKIPIVRVIDIEN